MTHPFHPLVGQRLTILSERTYAALGHTFVCDGGELGNLALPDSFTDRGPQPEAQALTVEALAELAGILAALERPLTGRSST